MRRVAVEIVSVGPPCLRCEATKLNVEKVVSRLRLADVTISMVESEKTLGKYGAVVSPTLVVNSSVKTMGRIPNEEEVERILEEAVRETASIL